MDLAENQTQSKKEFMNWKIKNYSELWKSKKDEKYRREERDIKHTQRSSNICSSGFSLGDMIESGLKTVVEEVITERVFKTY